MKTAILQDKFLDLVNLVLTITWYTFNSQFYQQTDGVAMRGQHLQPQQKFICRLMNVLPYLRQYNFQNFGKDLLITFILFFREALLIKSLQELLTTTACLSQKQTQTTDIKEEETRMSINLRYIEGTIEKLRRMLKSQKIKSTFYTESTLRKPLRKSKDRVVTNIVVNAKQSPSVNLNDL